MSLPLLGLLGGLAACATSPRGLPVSAPGELAYRITHPAPGAIQVEIRRIREAPAAFSFTTPGAVGRVRAVGEDGREVELQVPASGELDVPNDWVALRYRYQLDARRADLGRGVASGDDLLLAGPAWLLRPRVALPGLTATLSNRGRPALLPWEPQAEGRWLVGSRALVDSGFHAFGGRRCRLEVGRGRLEVAVLGPVHPLGDAALCEWIRRSAAELLQVRAEFPVARATVAVAPVESNEASPFGRSLPSDPRSLGFLAGTEAGAGDFERDSVALHQLLHLAQPPFPRQTWLAEGAATYFTELARTRSGRQSAEAGWEELLEGFERGAEAAGALRLEEVIAEEGVGGRLRAATWAGAFFLLTVDLELRQRTGGRRTLDEVFDALGTRTPSSRAQLGAQVDATAGQPIFDPLFTRQRGQPPFASLGELLEALGIRRAEGKVRFTAGPRAEDRDRLMRIKVRPNR